MHFPVSLCRSYLFGAGALVPRIAPCLAMLLAGCTKNVEATSHVENTEKHWKEACSLLENQTIEAASIRLKTGGAMVTSATPETIRDTHIEYCKVEGKIHPEDTSADCTPDIRFQLSLPVASNWNRKALQMGGSGYNGEVVASAGQISFAPGPVPLAQGYATYGSDSGHAGDMNNADFASSEGALRNFGFEHLKKTHDVAFTLIERYYGHAPDKSYFAGASTGGREGMTAVQRFPEDYDGVIAIAPAINFSGVRLHGVKIGQAVYGTEGGFIDGTKQKHILKTVLRHCDCDDGIADHIVSNVTACRARSVAILNDLGCKSGTAQRDNCLTEAQLNTVKAISNDLVLPYKLAHGVDRHQGYNILQGADFSKKLGLGTAEKLETPPKRDTHGYLYTQGDSYLRCFVANKNRPFDTQKFDLDKPGPFEQSLVELSDIVGAMSPDLSKFRERGGKLILMHGLADEVISPNSTIAYYNEQVAKNGQKTIDSFIRFYTVPGFGHGTGVFRPSWDPLKALDTWVVEGREPEDLQVGVGSAPLSTTKSEQSNQDSSAHKEPKRPMCRYPAYPYYMGGDVNDEKSYTCMSPAQTPPDVKNCRQ